MTFLILDKREDKIKLCELSLCNTRFFSYKGTFYMKIQSFFVNGEKKHALSIENGKFAFPFDFSIVSPANLLVGESN